LRRSRARNSRHACGGGHRRLLVALLAGLLAPVAGAQPDFAEEEEEEALRERLTERVDKRRPLVPNSVDIAGRPLWITGEYEVEFDYLRDPARPKESDPRLFLDQGPTVEGFYTFGPSLSLFASVSLGTESELLHDAKSSTAGVFLERGEMWAVSENVAQLPLTLEGGRLLFEDDRRWWWDEELDAVRGGVEVKPFELVLAVARELAPATTKRSYIAPDEDGVVRLFAEGSWDFAREHALELFVLHQDDRSSTEQPGERVDSARADDEDANLTWVGLRLSGAFDLPGKHLAGYWLDTALVRGEEHLIGFSDVDADTSVAEQVSRRDVDGWGFDVGAGWIMPFALEPRLYASYAVGSGDDGGDSREDRAFRQTGLADNEAGYGGSERFNAYGVLLEPELSNLAVVTFGAGLGLFNSSSLDLVYHAYRLLEPATSLRDASIRTELDGRHRDFGQELDLVLALEEWERFEIQMRAAAFRAGPAFGAAEGDWSYAGYLAVLLAF
jgi:hypothetical protein